MKITLFSDLHCGESELTCGDRTPALSLDKLRGILSSCVRDGTDLVICLGDFTDGKSAGEAEKYLSLAAEEVKRSGIKFLCLPGNHDLYCMSDAEFFRISGFSRPPFSRKAGGGVLIFLDACYSSPVGDAPPARYFSGGQTADWRDSWLPHESIDALGAELSKRTPGSHDAVVLTHQAVDPGIEPRHIIRNAPQIREVLERYADRVRCVVSGHYHKGGRGSTGGVGYITLPAVCTGTAVQPGAVLRICI